MENGLQIASKEFDDIEEIYSLEFIDSDEKLLVIGGNKNSNKVVFIIWDPFTTGEVEKVENLHITKDRLDRLARTSGNVLHVDNKGNVTSTLKMIELNREKPEITEIKTEFIKH